jgi:hypothetical protein
MAHPFDQHIASPHEDPEHVGTCLQNTLAHPFESRASAGRAVTSGQARSMGCPVRWRWCLCQHALQQGDSRESWDLVFPWAGTEHKLHEAAMRRT